MGLIADHKHQYALAAIPIAAYFFMITFEAGRYGYLGIPFVFVELTTQRIAQIGIVTLLTMLALTLGLSYLVQWAETKSEWRRFAANLAIYGVLLVPLAIKVGRSWEFIVMAAGMALYYAATNPEDFPAEPDPNASLVDREQRIARRLKSFREGTAGFFFLLTFFFLAFYSAGELVQRFTTSHVVSAEMPGKVVVGAYNGSVIVKGYDPRSLVLQEGFELVNVEGKLTLKDAELGALIQGVSGGRMK